MPKKIFHAISNFFNYFKPLKVININDVFRSVETGNIMETKYFLRKAPDLINYYFDNETMLHKAASGGHKSLAELLIKKGANVDEANRESGESPLHVAVRKAYGEIVELLLNSGADINIKDSKGKLAEGWTPLHLAAYECLSEMVDLLLSRGADISSVDDRLERTPLHWAVIKNCTKVVELLLAKGSEVNKRDGNGQHALSLASRCSSREMVELLIKLGADIIQADHSGYTPLHWAGTREIAEVLISHNGDLRVASKEGLLPIHTACREGKTEVAEFFIGKGENVDAENEVSGRKPLHLAVREGHTDLVKLLISQGALVDAKDHEYRTPLHYAACTGHHGPASLLIENGADVNAKDIRGNTPLHLAVPYGFKEVMELLLTQDADMDAMNSDGKKPFFNIDTPHFSKLFPDSKVYFCRSSHDWILHEPEINTLIVTGNGAQFINTDELAAQWISKLKLGLKLQNRDLPNEILHAFAEIRGYSISLKKPDGVNEVWAEVVPQPKEEPTDWKLIMEEKEDCWLLYCTLREMDHDRYRRYIITVGKDGSIQKISKVIIFVQKSPWVKRTT
jgi:ankyrin repeat protein